MNGVAAEGGDTRARWWITRLENGIAGLGIGLVYGGDLARWPEFIGAALIWSTIQVKLDEIARRVI